VEFVNSERVLTTIFSKVPGAKGIGKAANAPDGLRELKKIGVSQILLFSREILCGWAIQYPE
jgi:hypothetical protein